MTPDNAIAGFCQTLLGKAERTAIKTAARRGLGEVRDRRSIIKIARDAKAKPAVVLAAFGFLPDARRPQTYIDVFEENEFTAADEPTDAATAAAFALCRAICEPKCSMAGPPIN